MFFVSQNANIEEDFERVIEVNDQMGASFILDSSDGGLIKNYSEILDWIVILFWIFTFIANIINIKLKWKPEYRAVVIASRLEELRQEKISDVGWKEKNNQNIICVSTEKNPKCRQLATLPPGVSIESVLPLASCKLLSLKEQDCLEELKL